MKKKEMKKKEMKRRDEEKERGRAERREKGRGERERGEGRRKSSLIKRRITKRNRCNYFYKGKIDKLVSVDKEFPHACQSSIVLFNEFTVKKLLCTFIMFTAWVFSLQRCQLRSQLLSVLSILYSGLSIISNIFF